jgi:flagellar hook-length control protein FliK
MLQQIATAKSDIAAFAAEVNDENIAKLKNADEFAYMLEKENQSQLQPKEQHVSIKKEGAKHQQSSHKDQSVQAESSIAKSDTEVKAAGENKGHSEQTPNSVVNSTVKASSEEVQTDAEDVEKSDAKHWLSIVEQLASKSPVEPDSEEQITNDTPSDMFISGAAKTTEGDESVESVNTTETVEGDERTLLLTMLGAIEGDKVSQDKVLPYIDDVNMKKVTELLESNPELLNQLKELLASDNKVVNVQEEVLAVSDLELDVSESGVALIGTTELDGQLTQQEVALLESSPELMKLLQLPPDKLDKALTLLAKQLQQAGGTQQSSPNQSVNNVDTDMGTSSALNLDSLVSSIDTTDVSKVDGKLDASANAAFVGALKTGLAEVKSQLEKGREPGIDLKALINDAIKSSPELASNMLPSNPEQVELATRSVMQVLDAAELMGSAIERVSHQQAINATYRDQGINMAEQTKASQLQQGQLDKALNLAKPEAHQQLAEKVRFMVNANQLVADIRLDPAELGSMHVKVSVSGDSANVSFVVQSLHAKEAIDNAAPKLKEMLAEKGIELGQSSVEQGSQEQGDEQQTAGNGAGNMQGHGGEAGMTEGDVTDGVLQQPIVNGSLGGIDYFV